MNEQLSLYISDLSKTTESVPDRASNPASNNDFVIQQTTLKLGELFHRTTHLESAAQRN